MTVPKNLRDELLKQNGGSSQQERERRDMTLATDEQRVKRMKRIAAFSWATFLTFAFLSVCIGIMRRYAEEIVGASAQQIAAYFGEFDWFVPAVIIGTQALFVIAVAATFSLHTRTRTLTMHQIQASLAQIEEHLKKMAERE